MMSVKQTLVIAIALCFFPKNILAADLSQYAIQATIDTDHKIIRAHQKVTVVNTSKVDWKEIYFHVYPNRTFTQQEKNILMKYAGFFKVNPFPEGFQSPQFLVSSITCDNAVLKFEFEGDDKTILKVTLPKDLKPSDSVDIDLDFSVTIPHAYGRFGYHDGIFALSRWYPILSVYDDKGWSNYLFYPFHRPFYSEAARYSVELTVSDDQVVIHSGSLIKEEKASANTKTLKIESTIPIREFTLAMSHSYKVYENKFNNITIKSFYLSGHEGEAYKAFQSARGIMEDYTKNFGAYPYDSYSIAPVYLGYGGEQMSNMAFIDTRVYDLPKMLDRYFDFLIAHETGHQWFYNLVGIDEYTEMWLEEGVHSYFLGEYLDKKYGKDATIFELPSWASGAKLFLPDLTFRNSRDYRYKILARVGLDHPVAGELASFHEPSSIFAITYGKGSRIVGMLRHLMGDDAFHRSFERVFKDYSYQNLNIKDFQKICEQESSKNLQAFFDQWLYTEKHFDVAVSKVEGHTITLENKGSIVMPVDMKIDYVDGKTEELVQEIAEKHYDVQASQNSAIKSVELDPQNESLDLDRTNNNWPRKWNLKLVPLYYGLYDVPIFLPEDSYNIVVGPEIANGGVGVKASVQKPFDQIFYTGSDYEFSEHILHSRVGYQINNLFDSQTAAGFELDNRTDYDDGDEDLVSGKLYLRKELWPAAYGLFSINDHISLYLLRNVGLNQTLLLGGTEDSRDISYMKRNESIIGTSLHLERAVPYLDPNQGYKVDTVVESSQHFFNATQYFNRASIDASVYHLVTLNSKLAFRLKYGWGQPDDKNLYELGGIDGLRGFDRKDIRGSNAFLQSVEYRFPIKGDLHYKFFDNIVGIESVSGVAFFDAGQSWYDSFKDSDLKKDAGLGLRVGVNIGSFLEKVIVRIDAARAINDTEDDTHYWFGVNQAF